MTLSSGRGEYNSCIHTLREHSRCTFDLLSWINVLSVWNGRWKREVGTSQLGDTEAISSHGSNDTKDCKFKKDVSGCWFKKRKRKKKLSSRAKKNWHVPPECKLLFKGVFRSYVRDYFETLFSSEVALFFSMDLRKRTVFQARMEKMGCFNVCQCWCWKHMKSQEKRRPPHLYHVQGQHWNHRVQSAKKEKKKKKTTKKS